MESCLPHRRSCRRDGRSDRTDLRTERAYGPVSLSVSHRRFAAAICLPVSRCMVCMRTVFPPPKRPSLLREAAGDAKFNDLSRLVCILAS